MSNKKSRPTFLLLQARLPAVDPGTLLGRFVTHPSRPLDNYAPANPSSIIGTEIVTVSETLCKSTVSATTNPHLRAALQGLLDVTAETSHTDSKTLESNYIRTYRLQNHYKAFDQLEADPGVREDIDGPKGLFTRSRGKLYMIIGFKTCAAGSSFSAEVSHGREHSIEVTAPLSALVSGLPFVEVMDPTVGVGLSKEAKRQASFVTEGEQVFAVEYKVVKQRNVFGFYAQSAQPVLAHNPMTHEWNNSVYSDTVPVLRHGVPDEHGGKFDEDDGDEDVNNLLEDDGSIKRLEMLDDEPLDLLEQDDLLASSREELLLID